MQSHTTARAVAVASGCLATAGALALLTSDAIASGHWTLEHALLPVIVALTLTAGHLALPALAQKRPLSALGWAVLFLAGTWATVYTSAGRQAAAGDAQIHRADDINAAPNAKNPPPVPGEREPAAGARASRAARRRPSAAPPGRMG